jgi:hypothetical protein
VAYLDFAGFRDRTLMPAEDVDELEGRYPGWIATQLSEGSVRIDARLRKRYAAPFAQPYPEIVLSWLTRLVTFRAYLKRGVNPSDEQIADIRKDAEDAAGEIREAADAKEGLFDLPLRDAADASAISKGGCQVYAEASPWTWADRQREQMERNGER